MTTRKIGDHSASNGAANALPVMKPRRSLRSRRTSVPRLEPCSSAAVIADFDRGKVESADQLPGERLEGDGADEFEKAVERDRPERENHQHLQRIDALAEDDPVMHLQHEQRHGELQQVDESAEKTGKQEAVHQHAPAFADQRLQRRFAGLR